MAKYCPAVKFDSTWILRLAQTFIDNGLQDVQQIASPAPKPEMFKFLTDNALAAAQEFTEAIRSDGSEYELLQRERQEGTLVAYQNLVFVGRKPLG